MESVRRDSHFNSSVCYSEDHEIEEEELTGEDLQMALKGKPIPGSLGDDDY